ncbi:MAG: Dihydrolipoyllysine-residue succinyltransferase component of 2-oxoglutarate dehydrogenase complex [Chlamydiae bacterium]|nr:Dihydrolipoyllysine-residue succinyltransferase component of 2-oxoglutarate dehydrogenase complex [Chlamydiota bacterium]
MSEETEIKLPKLGESIMSATVVQWFKKVGDPVKLDEPLLEVSTDKVNSEIPSPVSGTVTKILATIDEELDVGAPLALIASSDTTAIKEPPPSTKGFFTPVVLKMAQERGIDLAQLQQIPATGAGGRLSKRDLENYLEKSTQPIEREGEERIKMTPMRKMIADNMVRSFFEAPHATLINEVDLTQLMELISQKREEFKDEHGYKLTITTFIASAIAKAAKEFPLVNSTLDGETIIVKKAVNLGIAVSVEEGILVPVIKNCDSLSIKEIASEVAQLSDRARSGRLDPDQVQEGTLTMTNFGMAGTLIGTPILRYGEVAIIGIGAITKKVVVLEDDTTAIRSMVYLTLTFDHRVLDGIYGCRYLASIKHHLSQNLSHLLPDSSKKLLIT